MADKKTFKIDRIIERLMTRIEEGQIIDVGRDASLYFEASRITLARAVQKITESGGAKIFYLPIKRGEEATVTIKVLAPNKWDFVSLMKQTDKIVSLGERKLKPTKKELKDLGRDTNTIRELVDVPEKRQELIDARVAKTDAKVRDRADKIERAKALHNNGYEIKEIAETLGVAESTVRGLLAADDERIDLSSLSTLTLRIRTYKREGLTNVAIGKLLGISESTVRRRLKTPLTEEETLLEAMMDLLGDAREELVQRVTEDPMFERVFGTDRGEGWILQVNTTKRRAGFTRRDGKGQRMTFTLEFSAVRKPVPQNDGDN